MWSLGEGFSEHNYCHACHTRFAVDFPVLLRKFTIDRLEDCRLASKEAQITLFLTVFFFYLLGIYFFLQYKDRIYKLLSEARLYNPSLPDFDG